MVCFANVLSMSGIDTVWPLHHHPEGKAQGVVSCHRASMCLCMPFLSFA